MVNREMNVPLVNLHGKLFWNNTKTSVFLRMKTFIFSWVHEYVFVNFNSQQKR